MAITLAVMVVGLQIASLEVLNSFLQSSHPLIGRRTQMGLAMALGKALMKAGLQLRMQN